MFVTSLSTMWPMLLDMTRDECRRTLRRLELEAYSSMISVFRAQGALLDDRKKILEDLRGALNISSDRHTAEARRVSNDELLATIAEQLSGPNTELGWVCEGRRKVPILPRSIPQTMYTELADQAAEAASKENEKIALKRLASEEDKVQNQEVDENLEGGVQDMEVDETCSPSLDKIENVHRLPIVMFDNSDQLASEEAPPRKKSRQDISAQSLAASPAIGMTPSQSKQTFQRYVNISQIYSNFSKTPPSGKTKEKGYSQSGKSHKPSHGPKSMVKHRNSHSKHGRNSGHVAIPHHQVRSGIKSPTDPHIPGAQAMNIQTPIDVNQLKSQSGFQANFAQSLAKKMNLDDSFDYKHNSAQNQQLTDSPTMQLLTQPNVQQETIISTQSEGLMPSSGTVGPLVPSPTVNTEHQLSPLRAHTTSMSGRPCQFIIKKNKIQNTVENNNVTGSPKIVHNVQVVPPKSEIAAVKVLQSRHIVMASPNNALPKVVNSGGKVVTAKFVQQLPPKSQPNFNSNIPKTTSSNLGADKVIIVSKPVSPTVQSNLLQRTLNRPKNIIISNQSTPLKEGDGNKTVESDTPVRSTPQATDNKVQAKTFLVNPKSGQKMVVLPAKARNKPLIGQSVPVMQVKGLPGRQTPVKLVPLGSQMNDNKTNNITIVSKPSATTNILTKVITKESLAHHMNSSALEGSSVKVGQVQIAPKPKGQAIIRQTVPNTKSNLIVLQKSNTPNKSPITFSKNPSDISKIVVTSKVSPVATSQSSNVLENDVTKNTGNVIVLQLTNNQHDQNTTVNSTEHSIITEDTPVLFHNQLSDHVSNSDSMESASEALMDVVTMTDTTKASSFESQPPADEVSINDNKEEPHEESVQTSNVPEWESSDNHKVDIEKETLEMGISMEGDVEGYEPSSQCDTKKVEEEAQENNIPEDLLNQAKTHILKNELQKQTSDEINQESEISTKENTLSEEKTTNLSEEQSKLESRQNRMDIFSTAIASADINLDSFEYLEDDMMSQDEILQLSSSSQVQSRHGVSQHKDKEQTSLEQELNQLMEEDHLDEPENVKSSCPPGGAIE